jgi:hypothetical protein
MKLVVFKNVCFNHYHFEICLRTNRWYNDKLFVLILNGWNILQKFQEYELRRAVFWKFKYKQILAQDMKSSLELSIEP